MDLRFDVSHYRYSLPPELIAQTPAIPRDSSRLLVLDRKRQSWIHDQFHNLPRYLKTGDHLVANNSRVMKSRLLGYRIREEGSDWVRGGKVEFLLLEKKGTLLWEGLFRASVKQEPGVRFEIPFSSGGVLRGELVKPEIEDAVSARGTVFAEFDQDPLKVQAGQVPLPPYIERLGPEDEEQYQTLYAKNLGSAAAPTAGLHFTPELIQKLIARGCFWSEVTLHVGVGTFRPVKTQDIRAHTMHEEAFELTSEVARSVNQTKKTSGRVVAVGTTSVRTLESAWDPVSQSLREGLGKTGIFIYPGSHPQIFNSVDALLTNFHLPESTLLMLVCAFAGRDFVMAAYQEAIRERYRFFSYGDAMLIV